MIIGVDEGETVATQSHESLTSFRKVSAGSERKFGLTVGAILVFLAIWPAIRHHAPVRVWLLAIGAGLFVLGLALPRVLAPLNKAWFELGMLLARITNPIVMGVMFFGAVAPLGWLIRARRIDLLKLRRDPESDTYWVTRAPDAKSSLRNQF